MKSFRILFILFSLVLLGVGCFNFGEDTKKTKPVEIDRDAILHNARVNGLIMTDSEILEMQNPNIRNFDNQAINVGNLDSFIQEGFNGWNSAALADVTGGGSYGLAYSSYKDGVYTMFADIGGLPELDENYFYEGWIVRRGADMSLISTGKVKMDEDKFLNVYMSNTNFSDHDFYVLTLEPDDGDLAPAEHILEGTFN